MTRLSKGRKSLSNQDGALHDAHRDALAAAQKAGFGITVHAAEAGPGTSVENLGLKMLSARDDDLSNPR